VCFSGGCFQNALLASRLKKRLEREGFAVYTHSLVPPNDGGIALGQAVIAAHHYRNPGTGIRNPIK
jgi:hydrogenase maturation protein HypF